MPWKRGWLFGLLALGGVAASAAEIDKAVPGDFAATVNVRVVNVEAVATDSSGRPVHGLKPADFRLKVDKHEVPIEYFTEVLQGEPHPAHGHVQPQHAGATSELRRPRRRRRRRVQGRALLGLALPGQGALTARERTAWHAIGSTPGPVRPGSGKAPPARVRGRERAGEDTGAGVPVRSMGCGRLHRPRPPSAGGE